MPGCCTPVLMNVMAGSWLIASVWTLLTIADVIHDLRDVRQHIADPRSVLAEPLKLEHRGDNRERLLTRRHARDSLTHPNRGRQLLAMQSR